MSSAPSRRWLIDEYRHRAWPTIVCFATLALTAVLTSSPGRYVGDNRFEQYFNPARRFARSLTIWDAFRGLGRVREDFWPGTTLPMGLFRSLGADPVLTQRLWHALLVVLVGVGVVEVLRLFRPTRGLEHLVAGLTAAFGAYSATFLTPFSNLYFQFVVGVWLVVVFYRGLHSQHPWRWAAVFALLVFAPGDVDTPGLVYNMVPLVWVAVFCVLIARSVRWQRFVGFVARAGLLTVLVNAAVIAKIYLGSATFGQRLNDTEAATISFRTSSWPESIRGLGNWLSYFRIDGELLKPQGAGYFDNWLIVAATFIPVVFALLVPWLSRWRPRILFSMMALGSLVVLVGAYPLNQPSPLGQGVLSALENIPLLGAFRNTYKIGSGLVIGVSVMFGYAVAASYRRVKQLDRHLALLPVGLAFLAIIGTAFPFWSGQLYNPNDTFEAVPTYWTDATAWLDEQPGDGRVLILPPTSRSRYRWGWVGDDIFDSLLARPHAVATGVPLTTPAAANLLEAISFGASDRTYEHGTLAPIARRLGFEYVIVRNDLDWQDLGRPRPSEYEGLRTDPDLELVGSFGAPGENTTAAGDTSAAAKAERALTPVEVYRISGVAPTGPGTVRVVADQPSLLVSGDGWAFPELVHAGLLPDGGPPIEYTGALEAPELTERFEAGSPLVITDTNRRRLRLMLSYEPDYSHTLAAGEALDREPRGIFGDAPDTESVAWFPDADTVRMSLVRGVDGSRPWSRAANAFDDDPDTQVLIRQADGVVQRVLRADLRGEKPVGRVHIDVANVVSSDDGVTRAELRFSDGTIEPLVLLDGTLDGPHPVRSIDVEFPVRNTEWIELRIQTIAGTARQFGFSDISFPSIDLEEYIEVPDDVFTAANEDDRLAQALEEAPLAYVFGRSNGYGAQKEETSLRRRFLVARDDPFSLSGRIQLGPEAADRVLDALVDSDISATSPRRAGGEIDNSAIFAVDGDLETSWAAAARVGTEIDLAFDERQVNSVTLINDASRGVEVAEYEITVAGETHKVRPLVMQPCPGSPDGESICRLTAVSFPPVAADEVNVRVSELANPTAGLSGGRVVIDEIVLDGQANATVSMSDESIEGCHEIGLRVTDAQGAWSSVPVRVDGSLAQLVEGRPTAIRGCEDLDLGAGSHQLVDEGGSVISIMLNSAERPVAVDQTAPPGEIEVRRLSPTRLEVRGEIDDSAFVILQEGFAGGWLAQGRGATIADGDATMLDTLNGWRVSEVADDRLELDLRYRGQFVFGLALLITTGGIGLCALILAVRIPASWRRVESDG